MRRLVIYLREMTTMKDNPVFIVFAFILTAMLFYGFWMDSRVSRIESQVDRFERIQRGD